MTRAGRRATSLGDERREAILNAAVGLLLERGFSGCSQRAVARRAEVPLGSVAYYFESSDALLEAAVERFLAATIERARQLRAQHGGDLAGSIVEMVAAGMDGDDLITLYERYVATARVPALAILAERCTAQLVAEVRDLLEEHDLDGSLAGLLVAAVDGTLIAGLAAPDQARRAATASVRRALAAVK